MKSIDDRGVEFPCQDAPGRIVSLVPSLTEQLISWGLKDKLCGRTRYCIEPHGIVDSIPRIGGTKNPDIEAIRALKPDLILMNQEENRIEDLRVLEKDFPCWVEFPRRVKDLLRSLPEMGKVLGVEAIGQETAARIRQAIANFTAPKVRPRVAYLIWRKPWMSVSGDTFIFDLLENLGFEPLFADREPRYFELTLEELKAANPDLVFLPSEPFPFGIKHQEELAKLCAWPAPRFPLVCGEDFCWPGFRTAKILAEAQKFHALL